jgi:lysozyme family protein
MDSNFGNALQLILRFEGGYVNDPLDKGGETNKGIIKKVYDAYRVSKGKPVQSVKLITDEEIKDIYYKNYWLAAKCDKLPIGVDTVHFDAAVNCGPGQAAKFLQRVVGATVDGVIGDGTLGKVNSMDPKAIMKAYSGSRIDFYIDLVIKDVTQVKFLKGWIKRAISFLG